MLKIEFFRVKTEVDESFVESHYEFLQRVQVFDIILRHISELIVFLARSQGYAVKSNDLPALQHLLENVVKVSLESNVRLCLEQFGKLRQKIVFLFFFHSLLRLQVDHQLCLSSALPFHGFFRFGLLSFLDKVCFPELQSSGSGSSDMESFSSAHS
jgi:hypothetical protein